MLHDACKMCKRALTAEPSRLRGYGKRCYEKKLIEEEREFLKRQMTIYDVLDEVLGGENDEQSVGSQL